MGRKLETAYISFGLVTIPVGIYSAISEQDIHFNQLHGPCGSRIKQQRFCPVCKREVPYDEIVKGYEVAEGQYVRIDQSDLEKLQAAESDAIEILEFVPLSAVDPIYFESTYYLGVEKRGEQTYQLLSRAMETMERVGLAKYVWRGKDSLFVIRSVEGRLLLHRMYYQDEIREFEAAPSSAPKSAPAELKLATQLIESISSASFDARAYRDEYRQRLMEMIEEKAQGRQLTVEQKPAPQATDVVDLMQRLKESVALTVEKKRARSQALPAQNARQPAKKVNAGRR